MGPWLRGHRVGGEVQSLVIRRFAAPRQLHDFEALVEQRVAFVEVDAERLELTGQVARAHAEDEASARQYVEGRRLFREQEGVAVRHHRRVGDQLHAGRTRGHGGEGDEGVERVVTTRTLTPRLGWDGMFVDREPIEPAALGRDGEGDVRVERQQFGLERNPPTGEVIDELQSTTYAVSPLTQCCCLFYILTA